MISIVVPTYNSLSLLKKVLSCLSNQTTKNYEIIVVDDSSNNEIEDYLQTKTAVRYYHNRPALGAVNNWNYGLSLAKGEYVILHHHDEYFLGENHLSKILEELNHNDVVVSNVKVATSNDKEHTLGIPSFVKKIFLKRPELFFLINVIGPSACFAVKKSVCQQFDKNLVWKVDSEWYYRILKNSRVSYLDDFYVHSFHGHSEQITQNIDIKSKDRQDNIYLRKKYSRNLFIIILLCISKFLRR